jgi:hypothetical protein
MNTFPKTKHTMAERGLDDDSYFTVKLKDGTEHHEHDVSWDDISDVQWVSCGGAKKQVNLCKHQLKRITVRHGQLATFIDVPKGCSVYQIVCARALFAVNRSVRHKVIGRKVGIVKDGVVVEEHFLDAENGTVRGLRF